MRLPLAIMLTTAALAPAADLKPKVGPAFEETPFGTAPEIPNANDKTKPLRPESKITKFTLINKSGNYVGIITLGGIVTEMVVPDAAGKLGDVVLGFDTLDGYLKSSPYFGCITGRVANRIANGKFKLDGKEYSVPTNNGKHGLHGGEFGFDKMVWKPEASLTPAGPTLKLTYTSPDGSQGYPGNLTCTVQYTWTDANELKIDYTATTDKTTVVNLTNHSYFNLGGHASGTILDHMVKLAADKYTPTDDTLIPTGKVEPVAGTPFDFTQPTKIGERIKQIKADPVGYDLNYAHGEKREAAPKLVATVTEAKSGRVLEVLTTEPGIQFYTGNFLDGKVAGKGGATYPQYGAFCLEAQFFPDSPNQPTFPSVTLKPGDKYTQTTIYKLGVAK
ncbi:MAG: galactose mutarotase [Fimbriiglobus sp.]|nr:galactose mutarotase [Fimbriiglobus sp.]